jgi:hypothetical protein
MAVKAGKLLKSGIRVKNRLIAGPLLSIFSPQGVPLGQSLPALLSGSSIFSPLKKGFFLHLSNCY